MIMDFDLEFLKQAIGLVDEYLDLLHRDAEECPDPDQFGIYDRLGYVAGFGFVACQAYTTAIAGRSPLEKHEALALGPQHRTGQSIAQLVNAAANAWKHSPEWDPDTPSKSAIRTIETIQSLGIDETCGDTILYEILRPLPPRFGSLIPFLIQWRDELLK